MHESPAIGPTSNTSSTAPAPRPPGEELPLPLLPAGEGDNQMERAELSELHQEMALLISISAICLGKQEGVAKVLQEVAEKIVEALDVDRCRIMIYQRRRAALTVIAEYSSAASALPTTISEQLPLALEQVEQFSSTDRTRILLHAPEEAPTEEHRRFYLRYGVASVLNVGLADGNQLIGVLALDACGNRQVFSPRKVRMAQMIADLVANTLIHSRQLRQIREHAYRLAVVNRITATVRASLDLKSVIQSVITEMRQAMEVDACGIAVVPQDQQAAVLHYFSTDLGQPAQEDPANPETRWMLPVEILDLCGHSSRPAAFARLPEGPALQALPRSETIQSLMLVPIFKQAQFVAVLILIQTGYQRQFTAAEMDFCQLIANQVGEAIVSAQLYEQVQQRTLELTAANQRLRELDHLKSEFLTTVSHELRTPLTSIIGYSELFLEGMMGELNADQIESLKGINRSGRQLLQLVNDVLDLSRIEAGRLELTLAEVSVTTCLREAIQNLLPLATGKGIAVTLTASPDLPPAQAHNDRLRQVLNNLLSNAIKFTEPGGMVSVRAEASGSRHIGIHISDTGVGIPSAHLDWIFQPFTQLENPLTRYHDGTGLGLSIVKNMVRLMGGQIRVQSEPNRGSTFTVLLPVGDPTLPAGSSEPAERG